MRLGVAGQQSLMSLYFVRVHLDFPQKEEAKAKVEVIDENELPVAELAKPSRESSRKVSVA